MVATGGLPEGIPAHCLICQQKIEVEPSPMTGDAVCRYCGTLVWPLERTGLDPSLSRKFQFLKKLRQTQLASAYLAQRIADEQQVVIWMLAKPTGMTDGLAHRVIEEATTMIGWKHPNVEKTLSVDTSGRHVCVVKEAALGRSMQDWLGRLKRLSIGDSLNVILRCAEALRYANQSGAVHRSLAPQAIRVSNGGLIKVSGFGLLNDSHRDFPTSMTTLIKEMGPINYLAPEVARDPMSADLRSDIYALGVMLYQLLTGRSPFAANTILGLLLAKQTGEFKPASKVLRSVPADMDRILSQMITVDPDDRYADYAALIDEIKSLGLDNQTLEFATKRASCVHSLGAKLKSILTGQ